MKWLTGLQWCIDILPLFCLEWQKLTVPQSWLWVRLLTLSAWSQPSVPRNTVCNHRQTSCAAQTGDICLRSFCCSMLTFATVNSLKFPTASHFNILKSYVSSASSSSTHSRKKWWIEKGYGVHGYQMGSSVPGFFSKQNKNIYKYKWCIFNQKKTKKLNKIMCDSLQRKNNPLRAFNQIGP